MYCRFSDIHVLARKRDKKLIKHELLQPQELPKPGTIVAIDAEFVSMQQASLHSSALNSCQ